MLFYPLRQLRLSKPETEAVIAKNLRHNVKRCFQCSLPRKVY